MNPAIWSYRIFPLGDAALTIDFGNCIDEAINRQVMARFAQLQELPLPGMIEAVPAYSSLTIHYDVWALKKMAGEQTIAEYLKKQIVERLAVPIVHHSIIEQLVKIPVCYERDFAPDMERLASAKNIPVEEVIQIHTSRNYKVYMMGFLPGFAYMGELDEKIAVARKPQPVSIVAGSIGIAGKQTGIYPLASPGGWQIIGRTPLKLFDASRQEPSLLKAGDKVQFYSITNNDFYEIQNSPLLQARGRG